MARTMPDEQEREIRVYCEAANPAYIGKKLLAELDAERAAHEETNALLKGEIKAHALTLASIKRCDVCGEECSTVEGHAMKDELAALKERLKLAEAVCESCGEDWPFYDDDALAAWRAGK